MDVHSKETRSYNMSRIRSKDTKPELLVRRFLHSRGFRFRLHVKDLPGKPDIVLPKYKTVIFVNGCFWHGHECKRGLRPKSNLAFWDNKMLYNKNRDIENTDRLLKAGWNVVTLWECELKKKTRDENLEMLLISLNSLIA
jgi:DNA mismatch endonuclease (patch repair protein)